MAVCVLAALLGFSAVIAGSDRSAAVVPGGIGRIVFMSTMHEASWEIYVRDFSGGTPVRLTSNTVYDGEPAWSPDGSRIAFMSQRDGRNQIYVMGADGTNQVNLSNNAAWDWHPAWSPDGSRIAFTTTRDGNHEVYVMNADGTNQVNLSNNAAWDWHPAWSPDGSKIAFTSDRDVMHQVYVMGADGTNQVNLSNNAAWDRNPAWSPDGSKIAFWSDRDSNDEIYVMDADGKNPARLTGNAAIDRDPAWSPDGSKIAFTSDRDGDWDIFMMNSDGTDVGHLTDHAKAELSVDWEAVNRPPVARDDTTTVHTGGSVTITVTGNDSDPDGNPISLDAIATSPTHGALSSQTWATVDYTHDGSASTIDTFTYRVTDGTLTDTATVTISITNRPPVARNDTATVAQGGSVTITVTGNDSDPDGDPVTLDGIVTPPSHGTLSTLTASSLVYSHDGSSSTSDSFTYRVTDGTLTDTGTATISVTSPVGPRFVDVPSGHTFYSDVEWLAAEGITKGCNPPVNDHYCPDSNVTRGQMAAFLVRALGYTDAGGGDLFTDDDGSVFEADIDRLGTAGVTKGCNPPTNDRFCPDDYVTRGQMAAFLVRALGYTDAGGGDLFVDDNDSIFEADIDRLGTAGVTKGCNPPTNTHYCPDAHVTRAQMAAFLHRALG